MKDKTHVTADIIAGTKFPKRRIAAVLGVTGSTCNMVLASTILNIGLIKPL